MLNTYQDIEYLFNDRSNIKTETSFALGISAGGKFTTKSGFTTEVYLGIGRNLTNSNNDEDFFQNEIIGRFGISLGYRF